MNRTNDFFQEIRTIKKKQGIPTETDDIIRPKIQISPFLKTATSLVWISFFLLWLVWQNEVSTKIYLHILKTVEKQVIIWLCVEISKVKLSEKSEVEFEEFENVMFSKSCKLGNFIIIKGYWK